MFIGNNKYVIRPSEFAKYSGFGADTIHSRIQIFNDCDVYEITFNKKTYWIHKNKVQVDKTKFQEYPIAIRLTGGYSLMEKLEIQ